MAVGGGRGAEMIACMFPFGTNGSLVSCNVTERARFPFGAGVSGEEGSHFTHIDRGHFSRWDTVKEKEAKLESDLLEMD